MTVGSIGLSTASADLGSRCRWPAISRMRPGKLPTRHRGKDKFPPKRRSVVKIEKPYPSGQTLTFGLDDNYGHNNIGYESR